MTNVAVGCILSKALDVQSYSRGERFSFPERLILALCHEGKEWDEKDEIRTGGGTNNGRVVWMWK